MISLLKNFLNQVINWFESLPPAWQGIVGGIIAGIIVAPILFLIKLTFKWWKKLWEISQS